MIWKDPEIPYATVRDRRKSTYIYLELLLNSPVHHPIGANIEHNQMPRRPWERDWQSGHDRSVIGADAGPVDDITRVKKA